MITHETSVPTRPYDHTVYEQQMFYFNTRGRVARYHHAVDTTPETAEGLDYCYDCAAEMYILALFLQHGPPSGRGVWAEPAASASAAIAPAAPADGSNGSTVAPAAPVTVAPPPPTAPPLHSRLLLPPYTSRYPPLRQRRSVTLQRGSGAQTRANHRTAAKTSDTRPALTLLLHLHAMQ